LIEDATERYFPELRAATLDMIGAQGGIAGWTAPPGPGDGRAEAALA
jgi:hypothetical protein